MDSATSEIYAFSAPLLNGGVDSRIVPLEEFRGRVLLIVNTASRCGFTPQYEGLEALYRRYRERGLTVVGFPSNQFGHQEPGTAAEIANFCERNYGLSFPMFAKIEVNGAGAHPLYCYLKRRKRGRFGFLTGGRIPWNFTKFLVARNGAVVARYGPRTKPAELAPQIEALLDS
jgi:glutathione peroxidase